MDECQAVFADFEVPDPSRIRKVHAWLSAHGHLDASRRPAVLEIGYARGGLLDLLNPPAAYRKFACDIHPRTVAPDVTFFQHDCNQAFEFARGLTFDVVFAGEIIEHIHDDRRFLERIRAILAPGGVLALTTPNLFFLPNRIVMPFGRMPYFSYEEFHYHFYSKPVLAALARRCGFEVRRIMSSHVLVSTRRNKVLGALCERLGDVFPSLGAHLILFATKPA